MTALSVRQPWASSILFAGKDVENRSWPTNHRGPLLIHAGLRHSREGWEYIDSLGIELPHIRVGGVIGAVDVVACVRSHPSRWARDGDWHWVLENPRELAFVPCRWQLGLFEIPYPYPGRAGIGSRSGQVVYRF